MMKLQWLGKLLAIGVTVMVLSMALLRIDYLVDERQRHQREAVSSVQQSLAGAQTVLGPVLHRECTETWEVSSGEGKDRRTEVKRVEHRMSATPAQLRVDASSQTDLRYRGLFKVNGYVAKLNLLASWTGLQALEPRPEHAGSALRCEPATMWLATSDVRGLRSAQVSVDGKLLPVQPGTQQQHPARGLHVVLSHLDTSGAVPAGGLTAQLTIDLLGTQQLSLVPVGDSTSWQLKSDWPHPSFGGRFLPNRREVGEQGFDASWSLNALATSAPRDVAHGAAAVCDGDQEQAAHGQGRKRCLDTLSVAFVDPVNPYSLSDRAIKYGLLFVLLTFTAVALSEALAGERVPRVHPIQYALVGTALCVFFLLLLSLSEHLSFGLAYAIAAAACVLLLGVYARSMLGSPRDGALFGGGMASLYGLLYMLLLREQTALVIGSIGLFAALAAVMLLTRRVNWYRLRTEAQQA